MICQVCKQDHSIPGNIRWCDRSDLEIERDYLRAAMDAKDARIAELEAALVDLVDEYRLERSEFFKYGELASRIRGGGR